MENEKIQLIDNNCKLHVEILNKKIREESLIQENSLQITRIDELEKSLISHNDDTLNKATEILREENNKLMAQIKDQDNFLNNKIRMLLQEKENLEITIQKFTKGNEMLDNMISKSRHGFNREGLGYEHNKTDQKFYTPQVKNKILNEQICSCCNKNGHSVIYCKAKNDVLKGKLVWVPKGTNPYK